MGVFRLILNVLYFFLHIVLLSCGYAFWGIFWTSSFLLWNCCLINDLSNNSFFFFFTFYFILEYIGLPCSSNSKESAFSAADQGLVPGLGRSSAGGYGNPLQYSFPENPTDRGAWRATIYGVAKSWTRLSD